MMTFLFHMKVRYIVDSAHVHRVKLPSIDQFTVIDNKKVMFSLKKPNNNALIFRTVLY